MLFSLIFSQETNGTHMKTPIYLQVQALFPTTWHLQIKVQFLRFALYRITTTFLSSVYPLKSLTREPTSAAIFTKKRAHFLLLHNSSSRAPLPENAIQRLLHQMCPNLDPYPFLGLGVFWILVEDFAEASIGAREIEREWVICVKI